MNSTKHIFVGVSSLVYPQENRACYHFYMETTCEFDLAWIGACKKVVKDGELFCEKHLKEKCWKCDKQATGQCDDAGSFVCGMPQCAEHPHTHEWRI